MDRTAALAYGAVAAAIFTALAAIAYFLGEASADDPGHVVAVAAATALALGSTAAAMTLRARGAPHWTVAFSWAGVATAVAGLAAWGTAWLASRSHDRDSIGVVVTFGIASLVLFALSATACLVVGIAAWRTSNAQTL